VVPGTRSSTGTQPSVVRTLWSAVAVSSKPDFVRICHTGLTPELQAPTVGESRVPASASSFEARRSPFDS